MEYQVKAIFTVEAPSRGEAEIIILAHLHAGEVIAGRVPLPPQVQEYTVEQHIPHKRRA